MDMEGKAAGLQAFADLPYVGDAFFDTAWVCVGLGVGRAVVADLDLSRYHAAGQTVWSSSLAPRAVC